MKCIVDGCEQDTGRNKYCDQHKGTRNKWSKNECLKERKVGSPYEIWHNPRAGWYWQVLKKWQANDDKPYARWFCAVKSPYTFGGYDMGDVYVQEIKQNAIKMSDQEMQDYLANNKW